MQSARKVVETENSGMKASFGEAGKALASAFAVSKIIEFSIAAVQEFAKVEKSVLRLGMVVARTGANWDSLRASTKAYIDEAERATRFQDTDVADSLTNLTQKTGNLTTAQRLNEVAMDLAVGTNQDLGAASDAVVQAYLGNERGLKSLARELGVTGKNAEDAEFLFNKLEQQMGGLARNEEGAAQSIKTLGDAFDNFREDFGETLAPAAAMLSDLANAVLPNIVKAVKTLATGWAASWLLIYDVVKMNFKLLGNTAKLLMDMWTNPKGAYKAWREGNREIIDDLKTHVTVVAGEITDIWKDEETKVQKIKTDGLSKEAKRNQERIAREKKAAEDLLKAQEKAEKDRLKLLDDTKKKADGINATVAQTAESAASQMVKAYQEGNLTVGKSFEILGKAIFKSLVKSIGEALIQSGSADLFTGMANLLNPALAPSAPGFFASGAFKSAAGGTIVGVAEAALADGGYVNKPTIALLGEAGPEKVTPLSGGHPMDSGSGVSVTGGLNIQISGVKDAREILTPGRVKALGHQLLTELDAQRRRQGIRAKRGG